ncbi:apoptosis regulatory protein Siva-like [Macrobrachium nipponense]|uniref:apoptosis regulatory protein Siva-like n=1 Tax=Macrobrachium nipponense TaxID=159736 RepID=UPI0030C87F00
MPKRSYPFGDEDSYGPQHKVHVGEKQLANGVSSQDKMKAVYDKTLSLLYRGAKNIMNNNAEPMDLTPAIQKDTRSNLHQMVLTPQGTLVKPHHTVDIVTGRLEGPSVCVSCKTMIKFTRPPCSYCECTFCDKCARSCHLCKGDFCTNCSLTIYLHEERVVCLSCC